jgi:SOS-response transcriptional repressor LexA
MLVILDFDLILLHDCYEFSCYIIIEGYDQKLLNQKCRKQSCMQIITKTINIDSKGENDMIDLTTPTSEAIVETKLKDGIVTIFVAGSTAAITTIEYEPGLRVDFPEMLSRIAPKTCIMNMIKHSMTEMDILVRLWLVPA